MFDNDEEVEDGSLKTDGEDEMDLPPEGMTDFGLDEEDPDKDR